MPNRAIWVTQRPLFSKDENKAINYITNKQNKIHNNPNQRQLKGLFHSSYTYSHEIRFHHDIYE
jgi:hypothetical protein